MNETNPPISLSELEDFNLVGTDDDVSPPLSEEKRRSESPGYSLMVPIVVLTIAVSLSLTWYAFNLNWDHNPSRIVSSSAPALAKISKDKSKRTSVASIEPPDSRTGDTMAETLNKLRVSRPLESDYSGEKSASATSVRSPDIQPSDAELIGVTVLIGAEFRSGVVPLALLAPYASEWKVGDQIVISTNRVITYRNTARTAGIVPAGTVGRIVEISKFNVTVSFPLPKPLHSLQFPPWQVRKADGSDRIYGGMKARISSSEPVQLIDASGKRIALLTDGQVVVVKKAGDN